MRCQRTLDVVSGRLSRASCTRFSPTFVMPAAAASSTAIAGNVFVTATSVTSSGERPARAHAAAIFDSTAATFARMASRSSISPDASPARGFPRRAARAGSRTAESRGSSFSPSCSSLRLLQIENAMTAFARDKLAAAQPLRECGTNARAARRARVVRHAGDGNAAALFERSLKLAALLLRQCGLELAGLLTQRFRFAAKIAERSLPRRMRLIVARFQAVVRRLPVVELFLNPFDLRHRLERRFLELLDMLARDLDFLPRRRILLLILHLHQRALIFLEQLLRVGQLPFDAAVFFPECFERLIQPEHLVVDGLKLTVDFCEGFRLDAHRLFAVGQLRKNGLQLPQFFDVYAQQLLRRQKRRSSIGTPVRNGLAALCGWYR